MFKCGEVVIYIGHPDKTKIHRECRPYIGEECEILRSCPHPFRPLSVFEVGFKDGFQMFAVPEGLRKKKPPEQPADEDFTESLKTGNLSRYLKENPCPDTYSKAWKVKAGIRRVLGIGG